MLASKKLTCKGTSRQVFIRVYRLEIQSVNLVFRPSFVNCCSSNFLSGSTLPPPFPVWISIHVYSVCGGDGDGVLDLRQINTCRKVPLQVHFFRWRHFALPFYESYLYADLDLRYYAFHISKVQRPPGSRFQRKLRHCAIRVIGKKELTYTGALFMLHRDPI